jgi:uncharacterized BrkB/YihY/UPF0761 family membrane protein
MLTLRRLSGIVLLLLSGIGLLAVYRFAPDVEPRGSAKYLLEILAIMPLGLLIYFGVLFLFQPANRRKTKTL